MRRLFARGQRSRLRAGASARRACATAGEGRPAPPLSTSASPLPLQQQKHAAASVPASYAHIWRRFNAAQPQPEAAEALAPPSWFSTLCHDLHFRVGADDDGFDSAAAVSSYDADAPLPGQGPRAVSPSTTTDADGDGGAGVGAANPEAASGDAPVDPYAWLEFSVRSEEDYTIAPYQFPAPAFDADTERALCLGDPSREYICFCDAYRFPDRRQLPTSVGTEPCRLWVDPSAAPPAVLVQLGDAFPPAMWLPVKPTAAAVRRVLAEFAQHAVMHRDAHHAVFEARVATATERLRMQSAPDRSAPAVLRHLAAHSREVRLDEAPIREWPNHQEFFLGEYSEPEELLTRLDLCPFLFALPLMRTATNLVDEKYLPTVLGPGLATSLYRCVHSKALLFVKAHLAAEVKLPPQDPDGFRFLWRDVEGGDAKSSNPAVPSGRVAVFARVVWPTNQRMSGGGRLLARFNAAFGTELAPDMPVDAAMALFYTSRWAQRGADLMGIAGMRRRVDALEAAVDCPSLPAPYPSTRAIPNPAYSAAETLGMHLQYLAHMDDRGIAARIRRLLPEASAPVRMGCAKAAMEAADRELFREIVSAEPPGRNQDFMVRLVRKRKARDLTDPVPRLLDGQYEFPAPLWSGRRRYDATTPEGALAIERVSHTGRYQTPV